MYILKEQPFKKEEIYVIVLTPLFWTSGIDIIFAKHIARIFDFQCM